MAYRILLDRSICHLTDGKNQIFYFPIPWERDTGFPSHPSLVADARHYCRINNTNEASDLMVNSFAGWQTFWRQKIFCCCGGRSRFVDVEIVVHHHLKIDGESQALEVKQMAGIKSADRAHIEKHYKLRRESRVDKNISIVRTDAVKIGIPNLGFIEASEECSEQFDSDIFKKEFAKVCKNR